MLLSVVVPVFNVPLDLLEACLTSVSRQTLRDNEFEVIIVDDHSTDIDCQAFVKEYSKARNHFRTIRHKRNRGLNAARRTGRQQANGNYILFLDGDDILSVDALERLRLVAHASKADIVTSVFQRWSPAQLALAPVNITERPFKGGYRERLRDMMKARYSFSMCGRLFHKSVIPDEVFNLPEHHIHEDVATMTRAMAKARVVSHVPSTCYFYTDNSDSLTRNFTPKHADDLFDNFEGWIELSRRIELLDKTSKAIPEGMERFAIMLVGRCLASEAMDASQKIETLTRIYERMRNFPIVGWHKQDPRVAAFLSTFLEHGSLNDAALRSLTTDFQLEGVAYAGVSHFPVSLQPSQMAARLFGKVVLICQVDYQLRNAATFAKSLQEAGHKCVILDNSLFASLGKRQLPTAENWRFDNLERIQVPRSPYPTEWLATAKLVLTFNDHNDDFRDALEYRNRLNLPSVAIVEGINDFLREDFERYRYLSYRRCSHVFLSGDDDQRFFEDRDTAVIGLPIIEQQASINPKFPKRPLAVLNVNFTYGSIEYARNEFVEAATDAFEQLDIEYVITQHPADTADLAHLTVSAHSQYELIEKCTVFVSRFATGILEALAAGKPAIYFNPHGEKVDKYCTPMGAFEIATTPEELSKAIMTALEDIEKDVDFKTRAKPFLRKHTAYTEGRMATERFVEACEIILNANTDAYDRAKMFFADRLQSALDEFENSDEVEHSEAAISHSHDVSSPFHRRSFPAEFCATFDAAAFMSSLNNSQPDACIKAVDVPQEDLASFSFYESQYHDEIIKNESPRWKGLEKSELCTTRSLLAIRTSVISKTIDASLLDALSFVPKAGPTSVASKIAPTEQAPKTNMASGQLSARTWETPSFFDGASATSTTLNCSASQEFLIEVVIGNAGANVNSVFSEVSPPMAMLIGPLGLYELKTGSYELRHSGSDNALATFKASDGECRRIEIVVNTKSNIIDAFIDSSHSGRIEGKSFDRGKIILGKGYFERFWIGRIYSFRIWSIAQPRAVLGNSGRIYRERITGEPLIQFNGEKLVQSNASGSAASPALVFARRVATKFVPKRQRKVLARFFNFKSSNN